MDTERLAKIIKRVENYIIKEKKDSFKSYLITKLAEDDELIQTFDIASLHIRESVVNSIEYAGEHLKRAMLYMRKPYIAEIAYVVGRYSINGVEFLDYLSKNLELSETEAADLNNFKTHIDKTNKLIESGYSELTASEIAESTLQFLKIDEETEVPMIGKDNHSYGCTQNGEMIIFHQIKNETTGKTFFVTFVIKDNDYLRCIGETTKDLVYVTNKKGTFSEFQTKRFNISSRENGESLNELNEDVKSLTISNDLLISIYEEIKELEQFDGKSVLAEEIYNKKAKKYNLK